MFDTPPPRTMASGSKTLMTDASPRASRRSYRDTDARSPPRRRPRARSRWPPRRGGRRPRLVVPREAGTRQKRLDAPRAAAVARRSRPLVRPPATAIGLCPHSPAIAFAPVTTRPLTTSPPPTPVPRITPNTTGSPAAAPSVASESAKQFASFASRTGRPSRVGQILRQRAAVQPRRVRVLDEARGWRYDTGHADADRRLADDGLGARRPATRRPRSSRDSRRAASATRWRKRSRPSASSAIASIFVPPRSMPMRTGRSASRSDGVAVSKMASSDRVHRRQRGDLDCTPADPAGAGRCERLNQIGRIPAARAPSMSAAHESPIITASLAAHPKARASACAKIAGSGLATPTASDTTSASM